MRNWSIRRYVTSCCFTCLNSGLKIGKKARIYQYKRQVQLCSAALYKKQVKKIEVLKLSEKKRKVMHFEGIKGKCWFAKYCSLTEAVVIDFMHLLGLVKQMLGLLFDSKHAKTNKHYYLGNYDSINGFYSIDFILSLIFYIKAVRLTLLTNWSSW